MFNCSFSGVGHLRRIPWCYKFNKWTKYAHYWRQDKYSSILRSQKCWGRGGACHDYYWGHQKWFWWEMYQQFVQSEDSRANGKILLNIGFIPMTSLLFFNSLDVFWRKKSKTLEYTCCIWFSNSFPFADNVC